MIREALDGWMAAAWQKALVHGHWRHTKTGRMVRIEDYHDTRRHHILGKPIGKGNTGKVFRHGHETFKHVVRGDGSRTEEGNVYTALDGAYGVNPGRQIGDYIKSPYYPRVVSVDTVPEEERPKLAAEVRRNADRINAAVTALSDAGYYYNDPLQFGVDDQGQYHLLDFSNASKEYGHFDARGENRANLERFYEQFGAKDMAEKAGEVAGVMRHLAMTVKWGREGLAVRGAAKHHGMRAIKEMGGKAPKYGYYSDKPATIKGTAMLPLSDDGQAEEPASDVEDLRKRIQAASHRVGDVISGKYPIGVEGRGGKDREAAEAAEAAGLKVWTENDVTFWAKDHHAAWPMISYLRTNGEYGTTEFSRILGYSPEEIRTYAAFLRATGQEHLISAKEGYAVLSLKPLSAKTIAKHGLLPVWHVRKE